MKAFTQLVLCVAFSGCASSASKVSKLEGKSEEVKVGMPFTQVKEICGSPDQSFNDPVSGGEVWFYKDPEGHKMLTVTFSVDEVVKVHLSTL